MCRAALARCLDDAECAAWLGGLFPALQEAIEADRQARRHGGQDDGAASGSMDS